MKATDLSIIIPIGPGETVWRDLLSDLQSHVSPTTEVIISAAEPLQEASSESNGIEFKWIVGSAGRARQLNRGAHAATGKFLWFLHADSRLTKDALPTLLKRLSTRQKVM